MLLMFAPGGPREDYFETLARGEEMTEEQHAAFMLRHDTYWVRGGRPGSTASPPGGHLAATSSTSRTANGHRWRDPMASVSMIDVVPEGSRSGVRPTESHAARIESTDHGRTGLVTFENPSFTRRARLRALASIVVSQGAMCCASIACTS